MPRPWRNLCGSLLFSFAFLMMGTVLGHARSVGDAVVDTEPPRVGAFKCPPVIDLWELLPAPEWIDLKDFTLQSWSLYRLDSSGEKIYPPLKTGSELLFYHRDEHAVRGAQNAYELETWWTKENPSTTKLKDLVYTVSATESCGGPLIRSLDLSSVEIAVYPNIVVYPGATLRILHSDLSSLNHAFIQLVDAGTEDPPRLEMADSTFTGAYNPQSYDNTIHLTGNSRAELRRNRGAFGIYLADHSTASLVGNRFEGYISVNGSAKAQLYDNTIAGSLSLYGPPAPVTGSSASASVISTTIVVSDGIQYPQEFTVRADYNSNLVLARSRLEHQLGGRVLRSSSNDPSAQVTVMNGWLSGFTEIQGTTNLTLVNNREVRGTVLYGDKVQALIAGNKLHGHLRLSEDSQTTFTGNVMPQGTIFLSADAGGQFTRNTFVQSPTYSNYAFDFASYPHPDPDNYKIAENCIERTSGLYLSDGTGDVVVQNNWWGDASGPFVFPDNSDGLGATITVRTGSSVLFRPYEDGLRPAYCASSPIPAQIELSQIAGPDGGLVIVGPIMITLPAGAVTSNVRIVYSGISEAYLLRATSLPPTGDLAGNYFFELSAVEEETSSPVTKFEESFDITVFYDDARLGASEESIALYWWDGNQWVAEPSSVVHPDQDMLTATLDHLTIFALLGEAEQSYLPQIVR